MILFIRWTGSNETIQIPIMQFKFIYLMQLSKFSNSNSNLNDSNSIPGGPYFNPEFWVRTQAYSEKCSVMSLFSWRLAVWKFLSNLEEVEITLHTYLFLIRYFWFMCSSSQLVLSLHPSLMKAVVLGRHPDLLLGTMVVWGKTGEKHCSSSLATLLQRCITWDLACQLQGTL